MTQKKLTGGLVALAASEGMKLHCGGGGYHSRITVPQERVALYKEVPESEVPKYTDEDYKARVRALIAERYTIEDEIALARQKDDKPQEWADYNAFCEDCKVRARELLTAEADGKEV